MTSKIKSTLLIIRPPYLTPKQHPLATEYYKYTSLLHQSLASKFKLDFYYQPQSLNSKKFVQGEYLRQIKDWGYSHYSNQDVSVDSGVDIHENLPTSNNKVDNIERLGDRSLGLLLPNHSLPSTTLNAGESLDQAALRAGYQQFGRDIDLWVVSKLPIAVNKDESGVDVSRLPLYTAIPTNTPPELHNTQLHTQWHSLHTHQLPQ